MTRPEIRRESLLLLLSFTACLDPAGAQCTRTWDQPLSISNVEGTGLAYADVDLDGRLDLVHAVVHGPANSARTLTYIVHGAADGDGFPTGPLHAYDVPNFLSHTFNGDAGGVGIALAHIDDNAQYDLVVGVFHEKNNGGDTFWWRIGWNLQPDGSVSSWSAPDYQAAGNSDCQGAGIAIGEFDGPGSRPDLVLMFYESPTYQGANNYRYKLVKNLGPGGSHGPVFPPGSGWWSVPGQGHDGEGADVAVAQLDNDPRPDLVMMSYDAPGGPNGFRTKIGWNCGADGREDPELGWQERREVAPFTDRGIGAGLAIATLDDDPRPDVVLLAYDPMDPFNGHNRFCAVRNAFGTMRNLATGCPLEGIPFELELPRCAMPTDCDPAALPVLLDAPLFAPRAAVLFANFARSSGPIDLSSLGCLDCVWRLPLESPGFGFSNGLLPRAEIVPLCDVDIVYLQALVFSPLATGCQLGMTGLHELRYGKL